MAENTITKILLRRGPQEDLKLNDNDTGALLDQGEPGFTTDTKRLFIGDGEVNQPIPRVDNDTLVYNEAGQVQLSGSMTTNISTLAGGNGCTADAAISAPNGGLYIGQDINCAGDVISFCSSDARLKNEINIIDDPLSKLNKIKGVTFKWSEFQDTYTGHDVGVLAQDVESTGLPGLVENRDNGYKAVRYDRLVPLLIECVKQLNKQVAELQSHIAPDL
jgi:hypothetical protein